MRERERERSRPVGFSAALQKYHFTAGAYATAGVIRFGEGRDRNLLVQNICTSTCGGHYIRQRPESFTHGSS